MHGLRLAAEPGGQLLGDEHVRAVGDLEHAVDRVVVGDRHEVHAAPLRELVDLLRRRGALGQPERALHAEPRLLRGGRVAVQVGAACVAFMARQIRLQSALPSVIVTIANVVLPDCTVVTR